MTHIDAVTAKLLHDARWRIANKDTSTDEYKRLDAPVVARIDAALAATDAQPAQQANVPPDRQIVIRTLDEYRSHFIAATGREPTAQEIWDTAHWSGLFRTCFTGEQAPVTEDVRERLDQLVNWLDGHDHKRTAADLRSLMSITAT
ncbi:MULTISPECIES: hypothetical protein [Ralstonia solanacearum species complex]|uniref:hypothetical protein n=1 Tax=Ralstonia phage RS138 TaxID=1483485 RepID=UPI0006BC40A9|nr:hypothetical protein [Ralstonia solanacearum]YP_009226523.1 hypothetical protein AXI85_gp19 [Ralstonia phage RS138]BEU73998.1 hypothetical protein MAFF211271_35530 [Ralstonia pseudosolanacearum]AXV78907.1 hypothetical protein CJO76_18080 [Ralstonia solanacearum]AXV92929.1 hypothetical protein CJO79_18065 [Ralstonia solanacearum]AXW20991.1 hypothetical protein CJO85_18110 [Ralstonia solanacearum]AXW77827.1 hypothetical protein CJO97_18060 [Ralstonia solanacearum]